MRDLQTLLPRMAPAVVVAVAGRTFRKQENALVPKTEDGRKLRAEPSEPHVFAPQMHSLSRAVQCEGTIGQTSLRVPTPSFQHPACVGAKCLGMFGRFFVVKSGARGGAARPGT